MGLTGQFALPHGIGGRIVGRMMAKRHVAQVATVVAEVAPTAGESVLEVGFGLGAGLVALAQAAPDVRVAGVDPSALMVTEARRRVRAFGPRVQVLEGTAATLPWDDGHFDAVCAVNSVQLWQPRVASMAEVLRVLKPGGRLVLSMVAVAVMPDLSRVGAGFDQVLVQELTEVGFAGVTADWRDGFGGHNALLVRATRPTA